MDLEFFNTLFEVQGGVCAICKRTRKLNVDHNHETGAVRGLLCHGCNTTIGALERETSAMWKYLGGQNPGTQLGESDGKQF